MSYRQHILRPSGGFFPHHHSLSICLTRRVSLAAFPAGTVHAPACPLIDLQVNVVLFQNWVGCAENDGVHVCKKNSFGEKRQNICVSIVAVKTEKLSIGKAALKDRCEVKGLIVLVGFECCRSSLKNSRRAMNQRYWIVYVEVLVLLLMPAEMD